jgi:hypothetical protein
MERIHRAFVIGNGPSLVQTNLDLLTDEITFGCNRLLPLYETTKMRVRHYVRSEGMELLNFPDPSVWADDVLYHLNSPDVTTWMNPYFRINLEKINEGKAWQNEKPGRVNWIGACTHYLTHYDKDDCPYLWHLPNFCSYGSSVTVAIQIAVTLGYSPIYLVGCDLGYVDGKPSHYHPDYEKGYEQMLRPAKYANLDTLMGHIVAKRSSKTPIYNATVGGQLEVYDRVCFEDLFK